MQDIRRFSYVLSIVLAMIAIMKMYHQSMVRGYLLIVLSLYSVISGLFFPNMIEPVYRCLMIFYRIMNKFNTTVFLTVIFSFLVMPIKIVVYLCCYHMLNDRIESDAASYCIEREAQPSRMKNSY